MFQPTNRGDNLAIEAITLTSKLPSILKNTDLNEKSKVSKIFKLLDRIREYQKEIRRFSGSKTALRACVIIDDYISKLV